METRLYLNDWGSYNNGNCGYGWMTTTQAREFLENSNEDKEWFIADIDTDFDGLKFDKLEYYNIYNVIETIEGLEELEDYEQAEVVALMEYNRCSFEEALNDRSRYAFYSSIDNYFEVMDEILESECPKHIQSYIDWGKYHNDLMYDATEASNGVVIMD